MKNFISIVVKKHYTDLVNTTQKKNGLKIGKGQINENNKFCNTK